MFYSLAQLRASIEDKIAQQGPDAPCAAFIFTQNNVTDLDPDTLEESYFPIDFIEKVLEDVGDTDYIYETIGEVIDDSIREVKRDNN